MEYIKLGNTNLVVSRLCIGGLTVGPLQANLPIEEGAKVLAAAFNSGVNFIDTAKLYKTYSYIRRGIELSKNKNIIIASKSYDYTYEGMKESVKEALDELGVKTLGIFGLHEQESKLTLKGHSDALQYLLDAKKQGLISAIGVSTHRVEVVKAITSMPEIDVVHPIYNINGLGIGDGTVLDMTLAIEEAFKAGKGIYSMKPLGGGNLTRDYDKCLDFVLLNKNIHSIALGMQTEDEVHVNILKFEGKVICEELKFITQNRRKKLHIDEWCIACGNCVKACKNNALSIVDNRVIINREKCLLCGYCSAYCHEFCIKIV